MNEIELVTSDDNKLHLRYPVIKDLPFGASVVSPFIAQVNAYTKRNINITDMTIETLGGGYALALGDTVHLRVARVDIPGMDWAGKINMPESRDVELDDIYLRITADDEYDQSRQVTLRDSHIVLEGGSNQMAFSEGAADISLVHDTFTFKDSYCGLGGRCDYGGPKLLTFGAGGADYRITNGEIQASWVEPGTALQTVEPMSSDTPALSGVRIQQTSIRATGTSTLSGINLLTQATHQVVTKNNIYLVPGAANSWCIGTLTGLIEENYCNVVTVEGFQGLIHIFATHRQSGHLTLINNAIEAPAGQPCIFFDGKPPLSVLMKHNTCNGSLGDR